ncbi:MAG: SGNH/GDSL hydrolase family protein [Clostridium sp.]|nr:SGNH/GDSL hydrolase family protein [Clostridium sp.]
MEEEIRTMYSGKKGVCFGDSITHLSKYPNIVAKELGCSIKNMGFSGSCLTKKNAFSMVELVDAIISKDFSLQEELGDKPNAFNFLSQVKKLEEIDFNEIDFVTVAYGTNDFGYGLPLGVLGDSDKSTIYGAIQYVIRRFQTEFPSIEMIFITPTFRKLGGADGDFCDEVKNTSRGCYLSDVVEAIQEVCRANNIKVIDNFHNTGINKYNLMHYSKDGLHPNDEGSYLLAKSIIGGLLSSPNSENSISKKDTISNMLMANGVFQLDSEQSIYHIEGNVVEEVNGKRYITNSKTTNYSGVLLGFSNGMCYQSGDKLRVRGIIKASYTGKARLDFNYFYNKPIMGGIYVSGEQKSSTIDIDVSTEEKEIDIIITVPKENAKEKIKYTGIKIINMSAGKIYVRNYSINSIDNCTLYFDNTVKNIEDKYFRNGVKVGKDIPAFMKIANIVKFKGNINLEDVDKDSFKDGVLILMYLPIIFSEKTIFAPSLFTDGSYRWVPLIVSNIGSVALKLNKENDGIRPKIIYLDQIDIINE